MKKLFNNIKNTAVNTFGKVKDKTQDIVSDVKGLTQSTETILLVVFVAGLLAVVFMPAIKDWFGNVITQLGVYTENLFDFAHTA